VEQDKLLRFYLAAWNLMKTHQVHPGPAVKRGAAILEKGEFRAQDRAGEIAAMKKTVFTIGAILFMGMVFWFFTIPLLLANDSWDAGILAGIVTLLSFKPFVDARWMA
jgi:hypothetical protein